uniref:G-protein coupled receptors family 2 profile 2 domain-containing protein n=3 Tax=Clytia hemisphaerica TaxID=252671 RepID=A0A7M5V9W0_9CNID
RKNLRLKKRYNFHMMHSLWIIIAASISMCSASECSLTDFELYQQTCMNNTLYSTFNETKMLEVIENCFPWISHNFPQCWQAVHSNITTSKCQQTCQYFQNHCPMLALFDSTKCFSRCVVGAENRQQKYENLLSLNCSQNTVAKTCAGNFVSSSHSSEWAIQWNYQNQKQDNEIVNTTSGCALSCDNQIQVFRSGQLQVDGPIICFSLLGIIASSFTVLSFLIDWKSQNRYPALILFITSICFMMCFLGWIIQFFGVGRKISCDPTNLRRNKEPRHGDSFWCILSFILIYFSGLSTSCWFVILNYSWYISFRTMGSIKTLIQSKIKYFHFFAWGISGSFTLMALLLQAVSAHPITNICFIHLSHNQQHLHDGLVAFPFTVCLVVGEFLLLKCVIQLKKLRNDCSVFLVPKAVKNLTKTFYRMIIYGLGVLVAFTLLVFIMYYEFNMREEWEKKHSKYIRCRLETVSLPTSLSKECIPPDKSRLLCLHCYILLLLLMSLLTSSWTWTFGTLKIWKKAWKRHLETDKAKERLQFQRAWYRRINSKKIQPFLPPINPQNPLEENKIKFMQPDKRLSLPDNLFVSTHQGDKKNRRHSDDIRSVVELFSIRRNTMCSLNSVISNELRSDVKALDEHS